MSATAAAHPERRVELWFMDEARVGQKGRVRHRWWLKGRRPPGVCDRRYDWAWIFGAVRPACGDAFALVLPDVSAEAMQTFLDAFAARLAPDVQAVVVLDQAGWHGAKALHIPETVTLVPLAPLFARTQPGGAPLALPARTLPVAAPLPRRRRHRRHLLPPLERTRRTHPVMAALW
ncbi:MAG: transposase [Rhodospirillales bacterium]|nr:transposase [Rhodospirillales bacterium]